MCWMNSAVRRNRRERCTEWIEELYAEDHGMIMFHHVSRTVVARLEVFFLGICSHRCQQNLFFVADRLSSVINILVSEGFSRSAS
jgi:hypothetical protein